MSKKFENIKDFLEDTYEKDSKELNEVRDELYNKELSRGLILLRHRSGLTQEKLAGKMGLTVDCINEIENNNDSEISVKTMVDYVRACGSNAKIFFAGEAPTITDRIEFHAKSLLEAFRDLHNLCKDDIAMLKGALKTKFTFSIDMILDVSKTVMKFLESNENQSDDIGKESLQKDLTIDFVDKTEERNEKLITSK